jgi:peptide/nickel transport system substrate-binding protein
MSAQHISRREFLRVGTLAAAGTAAAACAPETVVVKETVEVEKEKVVKETVVVEKEVEKEVTTVVEKEVTPTPMPAAFGQAPLFDERVSSGELPPIDERMAEEPLILAPLESIGEYGGTAHTVSDTAGRYGWDARIFLADRMSYLLRLEADCLTVAPALASAWEMSEDAKTMTIHLRKGIKWSDGDPWDADDIMFLYDDVWLNDELTPVKPFRWSWDGELMTITKLDDYTIRFSFGDSHPLAPALHARGYFATHYPKHYLQNYHPRYVEEDELQDMTEEAGFEFWYQLFGKKAYPETRDETYHPTLYSMVFVEEGVDYVVGERNPYYWIADTEGNQLPYIDRIHGTAVANREVGTAKMLAGEVDLAGWLSTTENYPLYQENAEQGQYKVLLWSSVWGAEAGFGANQTYNKDPVLRDIFRDVRFRRALSLSMDRDEINEVLYFGQATPRQMTVLPSSRYFEPEFAESYIEFDPDTANELLDEMGLDQRDSEGYRLRPDGQRLTWQIDYPGAGERPREVVAELVIEQWRENIGIEVTLKAYTGDLMSERVRANDIQMNLGDCDNAMDIMFALTPYWSVPMNWGWEWSWEAQWGLWYQTNGEEGDEPPQHMKDLLDKWERMLATLDEDERTRLGKEILAEQAENLWVIGSVGLAPVPILIATNLRNVPKDQLWGWDCFFGSIFGSPAWYFEQPLLERQTR